MGMNAVSLRTDSEVLVICLTNHHGDCFIKLSTFAESRAEEEDDEYMKELQQWAS
jgi:hypothetical protein